MLVSCIAAAQRVPVFLQLIELSRTVIEIVKTGWGMAGRKQHFIPKHFLKAFVVPDGSDTLWMFRRGLPAPVPVSRDDAAATRDFYSKPSESGIPTLDDLMTEYENKLEAYVNEVRAIPAGKNIPAPLMSEITAHLALRVAYLREFFAAGASELVRSIDTLIHRPTEMLDGIELPKHRVPTKFQTMAIEQFESHQLSLLTNLTPKATVRLLYQAIREDFDILQQAASTEFSVFLSQFQGQFRALGKTAHNRALEDEFVPLISKRPVSPA